MANGLNGRKSFLITGGAGFLGQHLCRHFLDYQVDQTGLFASANEVDCVVNSRKPEDEIHDLVKLPGFRVMSLKNEFQDNDIQLNETIGDVRYILHFASYPSPKDHLAMPIQTLMADSLLTMRMVALAKEKNARFLLASTGHIDQEKDPTREKAVYCEGKRFAEAYTMAAHRAWGTETRIVRMFNSYGPGMRIDDGRVVPSFIVKALRGEDLEIWGGEQMISLTYIDDMVDAIDKVLYGDITEPVEVGNPNRISIGHLAKKVIEISGSHSKLNIRPYLAKDERWPDLERANLLEWRPSVSIEDGLSRTVEDFRKRL